jgi:glycerophosphoryl diester phosphodiesterase
VGFKSLLMLGFIFGNNLLALRANALETRAHRGGTFYAPENILPAIQIGIEKGSETVEFDIHITSDKQIVVSHDSNLSRRCLTTDQKKASTKPIIQMTLEEVQQVECGSLPDPEFPHQKLFPGAKIPTLNQVFDLLDRNDVPNSGSVKLVIEIKYDSNHPELYAGRAEIAKLLTELMAARKVEQRVVIISFDPQMLHDVYKLNPNLPLQLLVGDAGFFERLSYSTKDLGFPIVAILPYSGFVDAVNVVRFHRQGIKVNPWYPNDIQSWQKMLDYGVDGVTTDDPEGFLVFIKSKS